MKPIIFLLVLNTFSPDEITYNWIQTNLKSEFSDKVFSGLSASMSAPAQGVILLGYMVIGGPESQKAARTIFYVGVANALTVGTLKLIVGRPRPTGTYKRYNSSFPSGHSSAGFYWATTIGHEYPKYRIPLYIWATGVVLSRVYLGRHWPSDVIAGGIIGYLFGKLEIRLKPKIGDFHLLP